MRVGTGNPCSFPLLLCALSSSRMCHVCSGQCPRQDAGHSHWPVSEHGDLLQLCLLLVTSCGREELAADCFVIGAAHTPRLP